MACNECEKVDPCVSEPCDCVQKDMSTDCSVYTGDDLECSGVKKNTVLTTVIENLDAFICNTRDYILAYIVQVTTLLNIGGGAEVFKQTNGLGNKELRTIASGDLTLVDVVQSADTIDITPGTPSLDLTDDVLSLIVTTLAGATVFSTIDLSGYNYDTFVQSASFDDMTNILTIVRNNGEPDITVDLSSLSDSFTNINVASGAYSANTITLTLTDASTVDIDLTTLVAEILAAAAAAQVNANYLESNPASKAYIQNRNPSKTETLGVAGNYDIVAGDNNYIIEIDNGANDVTIDITSLVATTEFFVGFVQKGTGSVTFVGYDILPTGLTDVLAGQGHIAAFEVINSTKYLHGSLIPV